MTKAAEQLVTKAAISKHSFNIYSKKIASSVVHEKEAVALHPPTPLVRDTVRF
jgi:hypothetical protein